MARPKQIFMPQCGLAPGFISVLANDLAKKFDSLDAVHMPSARPAGIPLQRAELQSHLVHQRADQRILQSMPRRSTRAA